MTQRTCFLWLIQVSVNIYTTFQHTYSIWYTMWYKNIRSISLHIHISDTQRSKTQSYPTFGSSAPLFEAWILRASNRTIYAAYVETRICVEYVQVWQQGHYKRWLVVEKRDLSNTEEEWNKKREKESKKKRETKKEIIWKREGNNQGAEQHGEGERKRGRNRREQERSRVGFTISVSLRPGLKSRVSTPILEP